MCDIGVCWVSSVGEHRPNFPPQQKIERGWSLFKVNVNLPTEKVEYFRNCTKFHKSEEKHAVHEWQLV